MSPRWLISAPTGAYCCSNARSVNSRSRSLLSPGAFAEGREVGPTFRQRREILSHGRALRARTVLFALIQLRLAVQRGKQVRELAHGLGGSQEEHAARIQCVVEQGHELLLEIPAHIDQQVAATDQVQFGKRRVFDHVLLGKDQYVAEAFVDAIGRAVRLLDEKSRQSFRRNVGGDAGGIDAGAGLSDGLADQYPWRTPAP